MNRKPILCDGAALITKKSENYTNKYKFVNMIQF